MVTRPSVIRFRVCTHIYVSVYVCVWRTYKKNGGIYKEKEMKGANITLLACEFISLFIKHMYTYVHDSICIWFLFTYRSIRI